MSVILLVDDDPHVSRIMQMWLTRNGYEVAIASNGAEALERIRAGGIAMVVSDLNMPVMDGATMVRAMHDQGLPQLPVILLTARCERDSLTKELGPLGVTVYPKPFVPSRLVEEVSQRLDDGNENLRNGGTDGAGAPEPVGSFFSDSQEL